MRPQFIVAIGALVVGCVDRSAAPARALPAKIEAVSSLTSTSAVGAALGNIVVKVTDANGTALSGAVVSFTLSLGSGTLSRAVDTTRADGTASSLFTLGTVPATNEVSATVNPLAPVRFTVTGVPATTAKFSFSRTKVRLIVGTDSAIVTTVARDMFGNATGGSVSWTVRDPSLVNVTPPPAPNGGFVVRVLRRPGQTYAVATSGNATDSILVSVPDAGSPCTFGAAPVSLSLGGVVAFDGGAACIRSNAPGSEYALVANYNIGVAYVSTVLEISGAGISVPGGAFPDSGGAESVAAERDVAFELGLRQREAREIASRVAGARAWRATTLPSLRTPLREGDVVSLNTNAFDFCERPDLRVGRVAAITNGAVVIADTTNPAGGFTDEEYRAFGVAMDTLVTPVDTSAFGAPSDIDNNGKVGIFFTRAVNELTRQGSAGGIILGFFYSRDLLPKVDPLGSCPGSNVGEMFYIMVPDINGTINANIRTKAFVQSIATATVGHEYQHLINASRRLYVNNTSRVDEEVWLNEGLSHVAEELLFYHASGGGPRQNIGGASLVDGSPMRAMFDMYQRNNFARYREYLRATESSSPLALDDQLATRGATWSFLRYLADRTRMTDGDFWRRLVNSPFTGSANIDDVISATGTNTVAALRDWSVSVLTDEAAASTATVFRQPSWNFITAMPVVGLSFALTPRILNAGVLTTVGLQAGGSSYLRFAVPDNQEAFLEVTGSAGNTLPAAVRLTVVRIK